MTDIHAPVSRPRSFKTARTVLALMLREMQTTYGRSPGGYLWAILEPVGAIAMFTLVFAVGLKVRSPSLGTNFPFFYATGMLPYALAMGTANKVASSLNFSRSLLFYPGVLYTDAIIARFLLNVLTQAIVFFVMMVGIHIMFDISSIRDARHIALSFSLAALFGLSLGVMNCFLFSVSPIWKSTWKIVTRPLMIISGVLFIYEDIPWAYQDFAWYNPLIHITGMMREGFFATYRPTYISPLYIILLSCAFLLLGMIFLRRYSSSILNR